MPSHPPNSTPAFGRFCAIYPPVAETPSRISAGDDVGSRFVPRRDGAQYLPSGRRTTRCAQLCRTLKTFTSQRWLPDLHPLYEEKEMYAGNVRSACRSFSAGPRDCIGKTLEYVKMRLIAARKICNSDVQLLPG
ncbi:hypothetical protein PgNI_10271 [Pyricularia grisea]|uniref:Uncharacterized protein n=1 Tax=Pyricularia grisea TaxID=148305 RepID=A0A6P8AZ49_PYRGI|nr:hypothetical protein PgNI_10271 [Pyricularia grisea]TLD07610.1 hypothetical protein PgNI_10271 [Pyricularia grisea]